MRWPLYLTLNVCLVAVMAAGVLGIIQHNTSLQRAQGEAMTRQLDRLIASWTAAGTRPEERFIDVLVSGAPEESQFVPSEERPFWALVLSWFTKGKAGSEHLRRASALLGNERPRADWYDQGAVWASERERRLKDMGDYLAKARQAQARIVVVAYGPQAESAWAAIQKAGQSAAGTMVVEKFITLGANPDALRRNRRAAFVTDGSAHVRERLFLWHSDGTAVVAAGNHMEFVDREGRRVRQPLPGDASKEEGAVGLVRRLSGAESSMEARLRREGVLRGTFDAPAEAGAPAPVAERDRAAPPPAAATSRRSVLPVIRREAAVREPEVPASGSAASALDAGPDSENATVEIKDFNRGGEGVGWSVTGPRVLLRLFDKNTSAGQAEVLRAYPRLADPPARCGIDVRLSAIGPVRSIEDFAAQDYYRTGAKLVGEITRREKHGRAMYNFGKARFPDPGEGIGEYFCLIETGGVDILVRYAFRLREDDDIDLCYKPYAPPIMGQLCDSFRPTK